MSESFPFPLLTLPGVRGASYNDGVDYIPSLDSRHDMWGERYGERNEFDITAYQDKGASDIRNGGRGCHVEFGRAAYDLLAAGGGWIKYPEGRYLHNTTHIIDGLEAVGQLPRATFFGIKGAGRNTHILPRMGTVDTILAFQNIGILRLEDFVVEGEPSPSPATNCLNLFQYSFAQPGRVDVRNVDLYGVKSFEPGGTRGGLFNVSGRLSLQDVFFGGCVAIYGGVVYQPVCMGFQARNTVCLDYANFRKLFWTKTGSSGSGEAWFEYEKSLLGVNASSNGHVRLEQCWFDEGCRRAIWIRGLIPDGTYTKFQGLSVRGFNVNGNSQHTAGAAGIEVENCFSVSIEDSWFGYSQPTVPAIPAVTLKAVDYAEIRNCEMQLIRDMRTIRTDLNCKVLRTASLRNPLYELHANTKHIQEDPVTGQLDHPNVRARVFAVGAPTGHTIGHRLVIADAAGNIQEQARFAGLPATIKAMLTNHWGLNEASGTVRQDNIGGCPMTASAGSVAAIAAHLGNGIDIIPANSNALWNTDGTIPSIVKANKSWFGACWAMLRAKGSARHLITKWRNVGGFEYSLQFSSSLDRIIYVTGGVVITASAFGSPPLNTPFWINWKYVHHASDTAQRLASIRIDEGAWNTVNVPGGTDQGGVNTGRLAFGMAGISTTGFWDGWVDEVMFGDGTPTDAQFSEIKNVAWPLEVGVGRIYGGEAVASAAALGAKTHTIPVHNTADQVICYLEGKAP